MEKYLLAIDTVIKFLKNAAPSIEEAGVTVVIEAGRILQDAVYVTFLIDDTYVSTLNLEAGPYGRNAALSVDSDYFSKSLAEVVVEIFWESLEIDDARERAGLAVASEWGLSPSRNALVSLY